MSQGELTTLYTQREREPDLAPPGEWMQEDVTRL